MGMSAGHVHNPCKGRTEGTIKRLIFTSSAAAANSLQIQTLQPEMLFIVQTF